DGLLFDSSIKHRNAQDQNQHTFASSQVDCTEYCCSPYVHAVPSETRGKFHENSDGATFIVAPFESRKRAVQPARTVALLAPV
ncbi:hypothetical protein PENTCL1PPCAC_8584, partial [Pristionchus entomophagus]